MKYRLKCIKIKLLSAFSFFILSAFIYHLNANQLVYLIFHDSVSINEKIITLGDIAEINGNPDYISQNIKTIEIGDAAPPGYSRYVTVDDILYLIVKKQVGNCKLILSGSKRVKVYTKSQEKRVGDYADLITDYLCKNIKWDKENYSIAIENKERSWKCYNKPYKIFINGLENQYPKGNTSINLEFSQENDFKLIIPISCRIKVLKEVVVVKNLINRNDKIEGNSLEIKKLDITNYHYNPMTQILQVIGTIAAKTLSAGTIVHDKCVKIMPDICKGEIVYITLKNNAIRVSLQAKSREDGRIGEIVWVESLSSHKILRAEVIGKGKVQLIQRSSI